MIRVLGITTLTVLLLAGCAPAATPDVTPTPTPSETATPTPEPQGDPQPTLPLTCADLLTEESASGIAGASVTLKLGEATLRNLYSAAYLQAGVLSCTWGGESKTDNAWEQGVTIDILPAADADFDRGVWQVDDGAITYPDGELSEYLCGPTPGLSKCFANVLLDGYWAQARVNSSTASDSELRALIDSMRAAITSAAAPRAAWVAPGAVQGNYCGDTQGNEQELQYVSVIAVKRSGMRLCQGPDGWDITVLPAGAWALPGLDAYADGPWWSVPALGAITIPGADNAIGADSVDGGGYSIVSAGGSAIVLSGPMPLGDQFSAEAAEILAAVVAAG